LTAPDQFSPSRFAIACGAAAMKARFAAHPLIPQSQIDHPLVSAALGDGNVEDTTFRRLSYEMELGYEISKQDPNIPADDLLYEVRSTLNRISTAAVALYR
jgi:hypothetical protein